MNSPVPTLTVFASEPEAPSLSVTVTLPVSPQPAEVKFGRTLNVFGSDAPYVFVCDGSFVLALVPVGADVVVIEVARELGHALVFDDALESAPRGIAKLLAPALGKVQFLVDLIEVDVRAVADGRLVFLFFELVRFRFFTHAGVRSHSHDERQRIKVRAGGN